MDEPTVHNESLTSVAIDGARISAFTASSIVMMDPGLHPDQQALMFQGLQAAMACLDRVRDLLPVETTSIHIARPNESGLIIPGL
jgi:hypothetical protein